MPRPMAVARDARTARQARAATLQPRGGALRHTVWREARVKRGRARARALERRVDVGASEVNGSGGARLR